MRTSDALDLVPDTFKSRDPKKDSAVAEKVGSYFLF